MTSLIQSCFASLLRSYLHVNTETEGAHLLFKQTDNLVLSRSITDQINNYICSNEFQKVQNELQVNAHIDIKALNDLRVQKRSACLVLTHNNAFL